LVGSEISHGSRPVGHIVASHGCHAIGLIREDASDEDLICETQSVVISGGVFAASAPEIS